MVVKNIFKKALLFMTCYVLAVVSSAVFVASADSTAYTMRKGTDAFKYGSLWTDIEYSEQGVWESVMYNLGSVSLDKNNGYLALQLNSQVSQPGLTFYVDAVLTSGGAGRTMNGNTGTPEHPGDVVYFVDESGTITTANEIYGGITIPAELVGKNCMLVIPVSAFNRFDPGVEEVFDWNSCYAFGIITNSAYNFGFSIKLGEIGYFAGDFKSFAMTKIVPLEKESDNARIINASTGSLTMIQPAYSSKLKDGDVIAYPMRKDDDAFAYGALLTDVSAYEGADMNGWEAIYYNFSSPRVLFEGGYLVYQIAQLDGVKANFAPIIEGKNAQGATVRLQTIGGTPEVPAGKCYFVDEDGLVSTLDIYYDAIIFSDAMDNKAGSIIVPIYNLATPSWSAEPDETFWSNITAVGFTTNTYYNYGFSYEFGEIGFYADDPALGTVAEKIFTLSSPVDYLALYYTAINSGEMSFIAPLYNDYVVTFDGASIRYNTEASGIRFLTNVDKEYAEYLAGYGYTVSYGTIILPADYVSGTDVQSGVTFEYLDGNSIKYLDIVSTVWFDEDEKSFVGSITNFFPQNFDRAFLGRGYMKVTGNGQEFCYYSNVICERTPYDLAAAFYKKEVSTAKKAMLKEYLDRSVRISLTEGELSYDDSDGLAAFGYVTDYDFELLGEEIKLTCTEQFGSLYLRTELGVTRYKINRDAFTFNAQTGRYEYVLAI